MTGRCQQQRNFKNFLRSCESSAHQNQALLDPVIMDLRITIELIIELSADRSLLYLSSMISSLPQFENAHAQNARRNTANISDSYDVCFTHAGIGYDHI